MQFENISDIKIFMKKMCDSIGSDNRYYDDLLWYSKANYTMSTEYYGCVRQFVEAIIDEPEFIQYKNELRRLLKPLDKMFGKR